MLNEQQLEPKLEKTKLFLKVSPKRPYVKPLLDDLGELRRLIQQQNTSGPNDVFNAPSGGAT